ncbi:lipoprotein-releasing system ATP-binding protein LolD [Arenimonas maotaiensis]|uniref:Lipoprotein-releasing system ATP-binding protein LolD n=1 Tax=Arenimonas maotaiensis TaxID=1446479 RepID=A0A917CRV9_9GAMM|nr:lipoprotein-releasing ABC transporter ATP-binding protein LolD [Arenimonas maotaiensis]GGF97475.1 lipoprotein-releasing system ATP-binding protein LolD [Arenimonas maotaiensis]
MSEVILSGHGLAKTYREGDLVTPVFSGIELAVRAGESLAVVGASGSGKSTLLHLLAGLDRPTEGHVRLLGEDLYRHSEAALGRLRSRHLGFIYQFHHLLPEFSALENVMMPLLIAGQGSRQAAGPAQALLEQVGLGHRLRHKPGELSGGERQRVAVARALVNRPACVLADEPTGNLDENTADAVFGMLMALKDQQESALVIVTHDVRLASRCDRVLELSQGRLRERGG